MIAALFVEGPPHGVYLGLPDIEPWHLPRDATKYAGPWPVIAHPPCARWCRLAGLVEARWGHKRGDDGGTFAAALSAVRRWGGVLEQPAWSGAWRAHGLAAPPRLGWQRTIDGGWVAYVEQGRYGHRSRKATWLYAVGIEPLSLRWGAVPDREAQMMGWISWCNNHNRGRTRARLPKSQRSRTPVEFRDELIGLARSVPAGQLGELP